MGTICFKSLIRWLELWIKFRFYLLTLSKVFLFVFFRGEGGFACFFFLFFFNFEETSLSEYLLFEHMCLFPHFKCEVYKFIIYLPSFRVKNYVMIIFTVSKVHLLNPTSPRMVIEGFFIIRMMSNRNKRLIHKDPNGRILCKLVTPSLILNKMY